ncbi:DUF2336 domain-containing protein [Roseibium aestuarii]|uniref:DUF2336 domain-containing protein n=2 Tax=Roseibium aestuarii TaxID=2600299 RepID=A0ABW4JXB2_9HYPH|nr:DUF2336 domain-containing protein [Roseibium aestuarii]
MQQADGHGEKRKETMLNLGMLSEMAKDASKTGRRTLISAVTDLFLSAKDREAEQVSILFGDIVMRVLGELEAETRMALSSRVSSHPAAPRDLITTLARDEISVAQPVLEHSPVLTDEDLVDLATSQSMDHLDAIAGRAQLDETVTEALVENGSDEVVTKVACNAGASLGESTFTKLVDRARNSEPLLEALARREDLPQEVVANLASMVSEELRERLQAVGGDQSLADNMAGRAMEEVKARASRVGQSMAQAKKVIEAVRAGKTSLEEAVAHFAKADKAAELGILLATVNRLPPASVSSLVYAKSDKPLIILCKANKLDVSAFKHILTMRARRLGSGVHELNDAMKRYEGFSVQAAKVALAELLKSMTQPGGADEDDGSDGADEGVFRVSKKRAGAKAP